ncbi:uncharacterized protein BX663DRAFT_166097 [Cokeromyces recurvatus]|uniref:uncharacterized protein n=1 Tax=Cokeromyces recurvatus TaxID=90255 RepID=UPI00221EB9E2|nr:uncharacterized protein BX663DRAFT_222935 [Cokeromyces recurvatus]XP_051380093.1 uncharacterized protein BX663DRAFT_166097 [Cokeromyces recurvatus]KAI7899181.1 hypothetical protein BX663DRAFT_222935 [Cokeromyces recurvatus]KAI7900108.1 hypothetical protein BX663DRAFT_166097 [Cokeromyces recurvatus]
MFNQNQSVFSGRTNIPTPTHRSVFADYLQQQQQQQQQQHQQQQHQQQQQQQHSAPTQQQINATNSFYEYFGSRPSQQSGRGKISTFNRNQLNKNEKKPISLLRQVSEVTKQTTGRLGPRRKQKLSDVQEESSSSSKILPEIVKRQQRFNPMQ